MATKSFTSEYAFNRKKVESLLNALQNDKKPRKVKNINTSKIKNTKVIASMNFATKSHSK